MSRHSLAEERKYGLKVTILWIRSLSVELSISPRNFGAFLKISLPYELDYISVHNFFITEVMYSKPFEDSIKHKSYD